MLTIDNVVLQVGGKMLLAPGFSMQVEPGRMACLTGESGCGKTSLLRACVGLVDTTQGSITADGIRLQTHTLNEVRRRVAYLPQELALPADTVREMVELPFLLAANEGRRAELSRLPQCMESLGVERELLERRTASLSGGQRQRIMLAVATLLGKRLLLLDEPSSALDGDNARQVGEYVKRYCEQSGAAALVVSHDRNLTDTAHKVWILR